MHEQAAAPEILVIEDQPDVRESIALVLADAGFVVGLAADGAAALQMLQHRASVELIVLDLVMPVMDGWQFIVAVQQDPVLAAIPIVAISADGSAHARATRVSAYLQKPFTETELLATIQPFLTRPGQRREDNRKRVSDRLALLQTLAASVGHEIDNPLSDLLGSLTSMRQRLVSLGEDPASDEGSALELCALLGDAIREAESIREIVRNITVAPRRLESAGEPSR